LKNILYISYDGMTDPLGQSQVLPYIFGLSKLGYQFTLISAEKRERYKENKNIIEDLCKANNINWKPIIYTKKPPIFSTLKDIIAMNKIAKELHVLYQFEMLHCRSYLASLIGLGFKRKHKIPFLFDMRGFWADERVEGGLWNLKNPLFKIVYNYFKKKELHFILESDKIISLTQSGKAEILNWKTGIDNSKIEIIPCCVDTVHFNFKPSKMNGITIKNDNEFLIGYFGSIGTWYLLSEMLLFFKQLSARMANAKFLIVTLDQPTEIINQCNKLSINLNNIIIKAATRIEMPYYINEIDYAISFIKPSYSKKASSPTKQAEIMAMGKPIISNIGVGDCDNIIIESSAGVLTDMTVTQNEKAINIMISKNIDKVLIRKYAIENFSLNEGVHKYAHVYNKILN
jgi:glycosyltransferase involved in cell wall biosynthesis